MMRETMLKNIRGKVKKPDNVCLCCCHKYLPKYSTLACYYFIIYAIPGESARVAAPRCLRFTTAHSKLSFPFKTELSPGCGATAPLKIVL